MPAMNGGTPGFPLHEALVRVVEAASRPRAVVAFDLDSTVIDNRPRQVRIFHEFALRRGAGDLLAIRPEHWKTWDLRDAMRNAGVSAERAAALYGEVSAFWWDRFFSGEYCRWDEPIPGAVDLLRAVKAAGATIAYVTGRHEPMRDGTMESLRDHGFPLPNGAASRVHLLMKPRLKMNDDLWKLEAHALLRALGDVVAAFDNEPAHANGYREGFPQAIVVHRIADHSGRDIPLLDGIVSIERFE
jgi:predicted secreted acid phosphatase